MRNIYTMKKLVKGLMLSAVMTLGISTASAQETTTEDLKPASQSEFWMGETIETGDFYLYNVGAKIFATDNTPSKTDINDATLWNVDENEDGGTYTIVRTDGEYVFSMTSILGLSWTTEISKGSTPTSFSIATGTTTDKYAAYKLSSKWGLYSPRYFNVDGDKYTAAKTQGPYNDWLLISETQKEAYSEYTTLFDKAASYLDPNSDLFKADDTARMEAIVDQLKDALQSYNYISYREDGKDKLEAAIAAAEEFINTSTGINGINGTSEAKTTEIYGANGARKSQLSKGINIVKMSDGSVKKVLVK